VDLCFNRCPAFFRAALELSYYQRLEVGVHRQRRFHLPVVVLEIYFVFVVFKELGRCGPFQLPYAFGFVTLEQLRRRVSMQTSFAEMFAVGIFALVVLRST